MEPIILHSDMNNFYASVEMLYDPTLKSKPVAVAGDEEARHGIVLAKNDLAKQFGIRTGQVLWEARQQCPELVCVPAHYDRYLRFSALAKNIYISYTDQVEAFGLDECWLDVTGSTGLFGDGITIANDIRARIRRELGLTVSVGVSYNKVFAKLGSDMKKPDATSVITPENFRETLAAAGQRPSLCRAGYHPEAGPVRHPYDWRAGSSGHGLPLFASGQKRDHAPPFCQRTGPLRRPAILCRTAHEKYRQQYHHAQGPR